jgi:hypothetical protein
MCEGRFLLRDPGEAPLWEPVVKCSAMGSFLTTSDESLFVKKLSKIEES